MGKSSRSTPSTATFFAIILVLSVFISSCFYNTLTNAQSFQNALATPESSPDKILSLASSTHSVIADISVGMRPTLLAFNEENGNVYVSNTYSDSVSVINGRTNKVIETIGVGRFPTGIAYNPFNDRIYVANCYLFSNVVSVIDSSSNEVVDNISVGDAPCGVTVNPITDLFTSLIMLKILLL